MADYFLGNVPAGGLVGGEPAMAYRSDTAGNLTGVVNNSVTVAQADVGGAIRVTDHGGIPTYYTVSQFACDSTATDIWTLPGNATTVVHVLWLLITSVATAAAAGRLQIIRRSAANSAGTRVADTVVPADTRSAAASSIAGHYTAHPTSLGTAVGTLFTQQFQQQAVTAVPAQAALLIDFRPYFGGQALRLSGTTDILAVNAAAALGGSGNAWDITVCTLELPTTA